MSEKNIQSKKVAVISAVFGGMDSPKRMPEQTIPFDFFYFNDASIFPRKEFSPRLRAKFFKLQSHRIREIAKYDIVIWIDGSFEITSNEFVSWVLSHLKKSSISVLKHPERSCIYEECKFVADLMGIGNTYLKSRYASEPIREQVNEYKKEGYPQNNGLYSCGLFARKQDEKTNHIFDDWWAENCKWSIQDQLSFPYVLWKNNMKVQEIKIDLFRNEYFNLTSHTK